ncbi:MAG: diphthine--ammonia ligase [bacterium]
MKAFVSWSGGKDSCLSCYEAAQSKDIEVSYLLNMVSEDGKSSRSHGISSDLLRLQAEAIGIPIIQKAVGKSYEEEFKKAITVLKDRDVQAGVFGDIDVQEHRGWIERVCKELQIKPLFPLWKRKRKKIMEEFIETGFKAIIVATNSEFLGEGWLGRRLDKEVVKDIERLGNMDICGENGEYHTFVYDGPIFRKQVRFVKGKKILREKNWFLELIQ